MGQKNQGIFSIEKEFAINRELTMTLMRLITITVTTVTSKLNKRRLFGAVIFLNEPRQCFK